jgi:hypothetical protein
VRNVIASGVWNKLKRCNLMCGDYLAALVPLVVGTGNATDVPHGTAGAGIYTETGLDGGFLANPVQSTATPTSQWFDTGWVPSANLTPGSVHLGVYNNGMATGTLDFKIPLGASSTAGTGGDANAFYIQRVNDFAGEHVKFFMGVGYSLLSEGALGRGGWRGHILGIVNGGVPAAVVNGSIHGGSIVVQTGPGTLADQALFIGANNNSAGLSESASSVVLAGYHVGDGLTTAEGIALSQAMTVFQQALGRWVHPAVGNWQQRVRQQTFVNPTFINTSWDNTVLAALGAFATACDAASLTTKIKRANLLAGNTYVQSVIPLLINLTDYNAGRTAYDSKIVHTSADYTAVGGWQKTAVGRAIYPDRRSTVSGTQDVTLVPDTGGIAVWVKDLPTLGSLIGNVPIPTEEWRIKVNAGTIEGIYSGLIAAVAPAPAEGFFHVVRASSTDLRMFNNGVQVGSNATPVAAATQTPLFPWVECSVTANTVFDDIDNWVHTCGYSFENTPLTPTEAATYYGIWYTAQLALGRVQTYGILTEGGDNLMASNGKQLATEQA